MELNSVYNAESPIVWRGEYHFPDDEIDSVKEKIISLTESKESQGVGKIYSTFFIPDIYKRPEENVPFAMTSSFSRTSSVKYFSGFFRISLA